MWPDLGYAGVSARKLFQSNCSEASDSKRLLTQLPELIRNATQLATFKARDERKTIHQHLLLTKDYSGPPTTRIDTPWTDKEAEDYLTTGWGSEAITEFKLEYLYGPCPSSLELYQYLTVRGGF